MGSQGEGRVNADPSLFGLFFNSGGLIEVSGIGTYGASLEGRVFVPDGGGGWVRVRITVRLGPGRLLEASGSLPGGEMGVQRGTLWDPAEGLDTELGSF